MHPGTVGLWGVHDAPHGWGLLCDHAGPGIFSCQVEVILDLRHFRQVEVLVHGGQQVTVFLPKDQLVHGGQRLYLAPSRFLVFATDNKNPYEVVLTREHMEVAHEHVWLA